MILDTIHTFLALDNVHWISFPLISEAILILFVAHFFSVLRLQYSTIKSYLCGVRFAYILEIYTTRLQLQTADICRAYKLF
jgi:hypothetical protein